jgi:hypothetical protein
MQETTDPALAAASYETAIKYNPYIFKAYPWLINYYNKNGQAAKSQSIKNSLQSLTIQPGPGIGM